MIDLTLLQLKALWLISKKPMHGYELMDKLEIKQGTIYPLLKSLENNAVIRSKKDENKKVYILTSKGKKFLKSSCVEFCNLYNDIFKEFVCKNCSFT